jgi:hypothetical protein
VGIELARRTSNFAGEDRRWLAFHDPGFNMGLTLDGSLFDTVTLFPDGRVPSGVVLAKNTSTGLYGPYGGTTEEVQTITEGGSGLTSFTLTYAGQTTASIDDDATAAEVQAALVALSNIAPGDVTVTGGPLGTGPMTVTFGGTLANTNVAQMTAAPTGGTGTVTIATGTAGGAAIGTGGLETAVCHLLNTETVYTGRKLTTAGVRHGVVNVNLLPTNSGLDPVAQTALAAAGITYQTR